MVLLSAVILTSLKRQECHTGLVVQSNVLIIDFCLTFLFPLKVFCLGDLNNFLFLAFFLIY